MPIIPENENPFFGHSEKFSVALFYQLKILSERFRRMFIHIIK